MTSSKEKSRTLSINFWDNDGNLYARMLPGMLLKRSNTVPARRPTPVADGDQVRSSLGNQFTASPDVAVRVDWEGVDRLEAERKAVGGDNDRTNCNMSTDDTFGSARPPTPIYYRRLLPGPMVKIKSPKGDVHINRCSFTSPSPYTATKSGAEQGLSSMADGIQEQTILEETVHENLREDNVTEEFATEPNEVSHKAAFQEEASTCVECSLTRLSANNTIPSRNEPSIFTMTSNKSSGTIDGPTQIRHDNPDSPAVSDNFSTRVMQGSRCTFIDPEAINNNAISESSSNNTRASHKDDGTKEATNLILQGRAAIGGSKYPFTINKNTGKQYFSPSQINRELRAVQSSKQDKALQQLIEGKKKIDAGSAPRATSALGFFGRQTEHANVPLEADAPPNEKSRWSPDSEIQPAPNRTSTFKKRLSGISFTPANTMSPASSPRPQTQTPGPVEFQPNSPVAPNIPEIPAAPSKPRILSIIPSLLKKSSKGKARESTSSSAPGGNAGSSSAGGETIAKFQLTPLSGLIKQSYKDLETLRTLKGNLVDSANSPGASAAVPSGDAARDAGDAVGALLVGVDFDRIEANLKRFEDLYEAFLAYGDGTSGGPAEEVHLVAMICKRSDVERGGMKSDNTVPRVEPS